MLKDHLELRVILKRPPDCTDGPEAPQEQRCLLGSFTATPSFIVNADRSQGVKVRLLGIGTPWSGEIPLRMEKGRRQSALVRIPTKEKGQCLTVWCRVVEEVLEAGATAEASKTRTLLLFSPMYMARSLLPGPMKMVLTIPNAKGSEVDVDLPGRSVPVQLATAGASDQKYNVALKVADDLPASDPIGMSWGIIEQVRDQADLGDPSLDEIIARIPKFGLLNLETSWPFLGGGEQASPTSSLTSWTVNPQPKTDVQVTFTQFHPLCNTLCMEINPWCLLVNNLGIPLVLKVSPEGGEEKRSRCFDIADASVFAPPPLPGAFWLGIQDSESGECFFGAPLRLSDQEWHFRAMLPSAAQGSLPKEGTVRTRIALGAQICFLTVSSRSEGGIRIMHVKPTYLLTSRLDAAVLCAPVSTAARCRRMDLGKLDLVGMEVPCPRDGGKECTALLLWQAVGEMDGRVRQEHGSRQSLFIGSVGDVGDGGRGGGGGEWSLPVNLSDDGKGATEVERRWVTPASAGKFFPCHSAFSHQIINSSFG